MKSLQNLLKKKILPLLLVVCLLSFSACGSDGTESASAPSTDISSVTSFENTSSTENVKPEQSFEEKVKAMGANYWEEYNDTKEKLLGAQSDDAFSFLMLSDIHIDYVKTVQEEESWYTTPVGGKLPDRYNIQNEVAMIIEMANTTGVDCILLGGDIVHGTYGHASALGELDYLVKEFEKANVPVFSARGNHDRNDYHGKPCALQHIITNEEWTDRFINPLAKGSTLVRPENDPNSPYYYVDFPDKKTRIITLDAWNYPIISEDGIHSVYSAENGWKMYGDNEQVEWFAAKALDPSKNDWNYVILSHAPITGDESGASVNANLIREIITAFNNKTTVSVFGQSVDYSKATGRAEISVSGHTHIQSWRYMTNTDHVAINTGSGRFAYYPNETPFDNANGKEYQPVRYEGTYSQAQFDAIVYNPKNRTAKRFNFGNRPDNIFEFTADGIKHTENIHQDW